MSTIFCKFNRPLLVKADTDRYNAEYKTIYGFALDTELIEVDTLDAYVGYLCILHCITNGDDLCFYIYQDGHPKIIDWEGEIHDVKAPWTTSLGREEREKLGLYYILTPDFDDALFRIDEEDLMVGV